MTAGIKVSEMYLPPYCPKCPFSSGSFVCAFFTCFFAIAKTPYQSNKLLYLNPVFLALRGLDPRTHVNPVRAYLTQSLFYVPGRKASGKNNPAVFFRLHGAVPIKSLARSSGRAFGISIEKERRNVVSRKRRNIGALLYPKRLYDPRFHASAELRRFRAVKLNAREAGLPCYLIRSACLFVNKNPDTRDKRRKRLYYGLYDSGFHEPRAFLPENKTQRVRSAFRGKKRVVRIGYAAYLYLNAHL